MFGLEENGRSKEFMKSVHFFGSVLFLMIATSSFASCFDLRPNDEKPGNPATVLSEVCLNAGGTVTLYSQGSLITCFQAQATYNPSVYHCSQGIVDNHCGYTEESTSYFGGDYSTGFIDAEVDVKTEPDSTHQCGSVRYQNYNYCFFDNDPTPTP
jgi:hypothetical protein